MKFDIESGKFLQVVLTAAQLVAPRDLNFQRFLSLFAKFLEVLFKF
jgi:hypothetical protein